MYILSLSVRSETEDGHIKGPVQRATFSFNLYPLLRMTNWLHCVAVRFGLGPETELDGTGREGSKQKTVASREMESGRTFERLLCIHAKLIDHN